jgi:hypothetical protein
MWDHIRPSRTSGNKRQLTRVVYQQISSEKAVQRQTVWKKTLQRQGEICQKKKGDVCVAYTYNPSAWEAKTGGSRV